MIQEVVTYFLHTDADIIQELVAYILGPYIPYMKNQKRFDKEADRLLHRVSHSIKNIRTKEVTGEIESPLQLTSASDSEFSLESESTPSQSPQQASAMSNNDSKEDDTRNRDVAAEMITGSPSQASMQQISTPQPTSLSETENKDDIMPISCESSRQTSDNEDCKLDDIPKKTMHEMLPQGEALIALGQESLQQQIYTFLSPSDPSDDVESIKNQLPRQATPNRSRTCELLSQSQYTLTSLSRSLVYEVRYKL